MIGKTISHYKILEELGHGGMGVVYKAEDTKLRRTVALKFLPSELTRDAEAKRRFVLEAQAASSLDHPNICTIHEIDETEEGQTFIAMACYEGESLKARIERGPLGVAEVLNVAVQIAQGLAKAHERTIIHRDIKPANVLITKDGLVKIVDFGLAKLSGGTKLTRTGTTPGTVSYMSPEQLKGDDVDLRSDIWALGVVMYEMVTGETPFKGEFEQAVIYSIINSQPEPPTGLRSGIPMELERIIIRALEKQKEDRYQHIEELLIDLRRLDGETPEVLPGKIHEFQLPKDRERRRTQKRLLMYATVTGAIIILVAVSVFINELIKKHPPKQIQPTYRQITSTGKVSSPSISPDGKFVAYAAEVSPTESRVCVEDLAGGQPIEVFKKAAISDLEWSPDGSEILIASGSTYIVPRLGGTSRKMGSFPSDAPYVAPFVSWSPDGSRFARSDVTLKRIWFTNISTGDTTSIPLEGSFTWLRDIDWSPTGDQLTFRTEGEKEGTIWTIGTDGTQQHKIVEEASESAYLGSPRWSSKGNALYYLRFRGQTVDLMKIKIDAKTGKAKGLPIAVYSGLQEGQDFSLSEDNARLLYTRVQSYSNLWLVSYAARGITGTAETKQLTSGTSLISRPSISLDGKRIVFRMGNPAQGNIFVMPIAGGQIEQLTFFNSNNDCPVWSPDSKEIAFGSNQDGAPKVWKVNSEGGTPRPFDKSELSANAFLLAWSPGSDILYLRPGHRNHHLLDPSTEEEWPLVKNDSVGYMFYPEYSPDGKKVAVSWRRLISQKSGIWIISLKDSSQFLAHPRYLMPIQWSADGNWIYAWDHKARSPEILMVNASNGEAKTFLTLPFKDIRSISMCPDGKKIVVTVSETQSDAWLVEHFDPEVKQSGQ